MEEISYKLDKVIDKPDHFLANRRRMQNNLEEMAKYHSLHIEEPDLIERARYTRSNEAEDEQENLIENLDKAWEYAKEEIGEVPSQEDMINLNSLIRYGKEAEIENNLEAHYRRENVRLSGTNNVPLFEPPDYEEIPQKMIEMEDKLESFNQSDSVKCTVERSNLSHLLIAYIHPFKDGNGRTVRMTQNAILDNEEIPSPVVPSYQKHIYLEKIHQAMEGYREGEPDQIQPFFDYMAGQIVGSLEKVLGYC